MVEEKIPKYNDIGEYERSNRLYRNVKWLESSKVKRHIKEDFDTIEELAVLLFFYRVAVYTPRGFTATAKNRLKSVEGAYLTVKSYFKDATVNDLVRVKNNLLDLILIEYQYCPNVKKITHYPRYTQGIYSDVYWENKTISGILEMYKDKYELLNLEKT